jgi:hypothetical protein
MEKHALKDQVSVFGFRQLRLSKERPAAGAFSEI